MLLNFVWFQGKIEKKLIVEKNKNLIGLKLFLKYKQFTYIISILFEKSLSLIKTTKNF